MVPMGFVDQYDDIKRYEMLADGTWLHTPTRQTRYVCLPEQYAKWFRDNGMVRE